MWKCELDSADSEQDQTGEVLEFREKEILDHTPLRLFLEDIFYWHSIYACVFQVIFLQLSQSKPYMNF